MFGAKAEGSTVHRGPGVKLAVEVRHLHRLW